MPIVKSLDLYMLFMGRPQCMLIEERYTPDKNLHKEIECVYLPEGHLQIQVDAHLFTLTSGEMLVIGSNMIHEFKPKGVRDKFIKLKFLKEWLMPPYANPEEQVAFDTLFSHSFKTMPDAYLHMLMQQMLSCPPRAPRDSYVYGKMVELAAYLVAQPELIAEKIVRTLEYPRYLDAITQYMHKNYQEKISLRMLSNHLGLTESYCSRYIKKHTRLSFVEYLSAIRVNCAIRLLSYTDHSITEIIDATGFFSVQTFNRVFKLQVGKTPTEYRKERRKEGSVTGMGMRQGEIVPRG